MPGPSRTEKGSKARRIDIDENNQTALQPTRFYRVNRSRPAKARRARWSYHGLLDHLCRPQQH